MISRTNNPIIAAKIANPIHGGGISMDHDFVVIIERSRRTREVSHHCRDVWFQMMMNRRFLTDANELCRLGVGQLTAGFSSGRFTPLEVAQATLARAEQVQERFNAFSLIDVEFGRQQARAAHVRFGSKADIEVS